LALCEPDKRSSPLFLQFSIEAAVLLQLLRHELFLVYHAAVRTDPLRDLRYE